MLLIQFQKAYNTTKPQCSCSLLMTGVNNPQASPQRPPHLRPRQPGQWSGTNLRVKEDIVDDCDAGGAEYCVAADNHAHLGLSGGGALRACSWCIRPCRLMAGCQIYVFVPIRPCRLKAGCQVYVFVPIAIATLGRRLTARSTALLPFQLSD